MRIKHLALSAAALLGLGSVTGYFGYQNSVKEQEAVHHAPQTEPGVCVEHAITEVIPNMTVGGVVYAEDRVERYRRFGEYLHYRDRDRAEITSIAVDLDNDEWDNIQIRTDESWLAVPPTGLGDTVAEMFNVQSFASYASTFDLEAEPKITERASEHTIEKHRQLIEKIQACFK